MNIPCHLLAGACAGLWLWSVACSGQDEATRRHPPAKGGSPQPTGPAKTATALPIIPGAAGFGMQTPAGSGRHLRGLSAGPATRQAVLRHWDFDDGVPAGGELTGESAFVKRGNRQTLTFKGKGALRLSQTDGYLKAGGSFTVMAWVRLDAVGGIVAESKAADGSLWELGTTASFGGKWRFYLVNAEGQKNHAVWSSALSAGTWRHMAAVYTDAGQIRLYLNGNRVHDGWNKTIKAVAATRSSNLLIGRGLKGELDDVMLLNRPLGDHQVLAIYARQQSAYFTTPADVYRVTNLNDSGPGSLREGIETQERARTIVFEVSGNIDLKERLVLGPANAYLTIAGATAPSPGITIKHYGFRIGQGCHDVLIRHLRIRTGDTSVVGRLPGRWTDVDGDGPGTVFSHPLRVEPQKHYGGGSQRSVWWNGGNLAEDPGKTRNVGPYKWDWESGTGNDKPTRSDQGVLYVNVGQDPSRGRLEYGLSKSSVSDPLTITPNVRHVVVDHLSCTWGGDMNMQSQGTHVTIRNCLSAEALHHPRHPKGPHSRGLLIFAYGPAQGQYVAVLGNLFAFNMARNPSVNKGRHVVVANNLISDVNVGIKSSAVPGYPASVSIQKNVVRRARTPLLARVVSDEPHTSKIHITPDNQVSGQTFESIADIWAKAVRNPFKRGDVPKICQVETAPVSVPGLTLKPVARVEQWVLANAGARPADRDPVDERIIRNVKTGRGKLPIESQEDVGGWPDLAENHRTLALPDDPYGDDDRDGYTNLEEWLHAFAAEVEGGDS